MLCLLTLKREQISWNVKVLYSAVSFRVTHEIPLQQQKKLVNPSFTPKVSDLSRCTMSETLELFLVAVLLSQIYIIITISLSISAFELTD